MKVHFFDAGQALSVLVDLPNGRHVLVDSGLTLLQVGHHGSDTSSSTGFLDTVKPKYAVISAGKIGEGTKTGYCHPRAVTVKNLTDRMGGAGAQTIKAFVSSSGVPKCADAKASDWVETPASDRIWSTPRDGEVTLTTTGDGKFARGQ